MRIAASRSMFQQEADVRVLVAKMNRREQLLKRLDKAWRVFRESYAGLSDAEVLEQGVTGLWSVRDIIAHVTTWEEEALKHLPLILKGGKPPRYSVTYGGINSFNALATKEKKGFSLSEVLQQSDAIHHRLITLIENAPEDQLGGETRFRRRVRLDTYGHYPKHAGAIRKWRQCQPSVRRP
jgi:DinB superfamily